MKNMVFPTSGPVEDIVRGRSTVLMVLSEDRRSHRLKFRQCRHKQPAYIDMCRLDNLDSSGRKGYRRSPNLGTAWMQDDRRPVLKKVSRNAWSSSDPVCSLSLSLCILRRFTHFFLSSSSSDDLSTLT